MANSQMDRLDRRLECFTNMLICFNVFAFITAASAFSLTIWVRFDGNFEGWINELGMEHYYTGIYFLMFSSIITCAVTFLGCFAAFTESTKLLLIYAAICVVAFIGNLVGSSFLLANGLSSSQLTPWLTNKITDLIVHSQDERAAEALRVIQESVGCCGAEGPNDYINMNMPVPGECRNTVTGNVFQYGCVEHFSQLVEIRSAWISGIALITAAMLIVMAVLAICVRSKINALNRHEDRTYRTVNAK